MSAHKGNGTGPGIGPEAPGGLDLDGARRIGAEELANRPGDHNNLGDAQRHAEWSRRMSVELDPFTLAVAGFGHEVDGLINGQPLDEFFMDLHNNAVGRAAAVANTPIDPSQLRVLNPPNSSPVPLRVY